MHRLGIFLDRVCGLVAGLSMVGMIAVNFADSIGRQINHPVLGAQEVVTFLLCIFFFSAVPILVRENAHIRVGLFVELYGKGMRRAEAVFSAVFEAACTLLLTYMVYDFAGRLARVGTVSAHYELPKAPFIYASAALLCIAIYFVIERYAEHLPDRRSAAEKAAHKLHGTDPK